MSTAYYGEVPLPEALAKSLNSVSVRITLAARSGWVWTSLTIACVIASAWSSGC